MDRSAYGFVLVAGFAAFAGGGCSSSTDSSSYGSGASNGTGAMSGSGATYGSGGSNGSGASSGSGGSSSGGSSTYVPPTCDQACQDYLVSWALDDTIWFLWGLEFTGKPVGAQDVMASCPLGGSAHITGTDSVSNNITTTDMLFDLQDCENSKEQYSLTFTGAVMLQGSFNGDIDYAAVNFSAPTLDAVGSLNWLDDPAINEACPMHFAQQGGGDTFSISGKRCGRAFNEGSLDTGTGSGGSSGTGGSTSSGGSGGSSNACACFCPDGSDCTNATDPNPCGVDANGIPEACGCPVNCP